MLKIFNTLTKKLEEFKPIEPGKVRFYQCGPTVYWTQHIGNLRAMTMADLIRRTLMYTGYDVKFVRNYTDVGHLVSDGDEGEDKMEKGAKRERLTPMQIAAKYIDIFEKDINALNILDPTFKPRATEYISEMIAMIQLLLDKDFAYVTSKAIYFDVTKYPGYTQLSGQKLEHNLEGEGKGEVSDLEKKHPQDFALWFFKTGIHKNALQTWNSPFSSAEVTQGEGFPGWHIECSAMTKSTLGDSLDLHMGGIEHIPVHHPNEIAQSECANGVKFVNYWLHNEHLTVNDAKMAKSEGTGFALSELIQRGFSGIVLRYFFLTAHYRSKQNFTWEALEAAKTSLERLVKRVEELKSQVKEERSNISEEFAARFKEAIEDDFNIPKALAVAWDLIKSELDSSVKLSTIFKFDEVLGLDLKSSRKAAHNIPEEAIELIEKRQLARENKEWETADKLRDELKTRFGIESEDKSSNKV